MAKHKAVGSPVPESLVVGGGSLEDAFSCFSNVFSVDSFFLTWDTEGSI